MIDVDKTTEDKILAECKGLSVLQRELIQNLWSNYGSLERWHLQDAQHRSVIVKTVVPPAAKSHPRGWNDDFAHTRKLNSYRAEIAWYRSQPLHRGIPQLVYAESEDDSFCLVLEDLGLDGFQSEMHPDQAQIEAIVRWLAEFHKAYLGKQVPGIWPQGCYWHFETRPQEWEAMPDSPLKTHADAIDQILQNSRHKTVVHGDAKIANFLCGPKGSGSISAVDFQYVGCGVGVQDLAYFLSSVYNSEQCYARAPHLLDLYFKHMNAPSELEEEWRTLYPFAWADFVRFLEGWSPGHWKLGSYAQEQTDLALQRLQSS